MSVINSPDYDSLILECDGCNRRYRPSGGAATWEGLRTKACARGWTFQKVHGWPFVLDRCAECAKNAPKPPHEARNEARKRRRKS